EIPAAITAGAIICGSYFGDKMSPCSDTTNITAAVTETDIMEHIKHMWYEQVPSYIIMALIFILIGFKYRSATIDYGNVNFILETFEANFNTGIVALLPAIIVLILLVMKVPAFISLMIGALSGGIVAILYQGSKLTGILGIFYQGFSIE